MHPTRLRAVLIALAAFLGACSPGWSATFSSRYGATSTLMPDGNILIIGGQTTDNPASVLSGAGSVQMALEQNGLFQDMNSTGFGARSSHTATLLPTGEVLVVGGKDSSGNAIVTAQIFNPIGNCWRASVSMQETDGRFNHTATLLKNGKVLVCGGQTSSGVLAEQTSNTCELFVPTAGPALQDACATAGGSFTGGTIGLLAPRSLHTASLLRDGQVFITGGLDTTGFSTGGYMLTSERYDPVANAVFAAARLHDARAYHRATVMGNGKVLISGGFTDKNTAENRGYLDTVEIYDPVQNTMTPARKMQARKQQQSSVTEPDGRISLQGGLGNITTTYIMQNFSKGIDEGGNITGCFWPTGTAPGPGVAGICPGGTDPQGAAKLSTMSITGGAINLRVESKLSVPVTGTIEDGSILFSSPAITFAGGTVYLIPGRENQQTGALSGTIASLNGTNVFCDQSRGCGAFNGLYSIPMKGQYFLTPDFAANGVISALTAPSTVDWNPTPLCSGCANSSGSITPTSQLTGNIVINGLPAEYINHNISSGVLHVTAGTITNDLLTLSISDAWAVIPADTPITQDLAGLGRINATITITNFAPVLGGRVEVATTTAQSAQSFTGKKLDGITGKLHMVVDGLTLGPSDNFKVDVATVVIRRMTFGDVETYDPLDNSWSFTFQPKFGGGFYGHTATLDPTGTTRTFGGRECGDATCTIELPLFYEGLIQRLPPFTSVSGTLAMPRGNHSSTLLPNGKILIAGGSNGPNVLDTAELYEPTTRRFKDTGTMSEARDLHTATLLPNGRVLVAGGFTTNAFSTGATNGAEIYYPEPGVWVKTSTLPFATDNHTATLLPDGNVLVVGGYNGIYLSSAAIYYSTSATWARLPNMPSNRALHTATLLQDGRVLFVGGINQSGVLSTSLLYDPNSNPALPNYPWVTGPGLPNAAETSLHSATLLKTGQVLVAGGNDRHGETSLSLLYTPDVSPGIGSWVNTNTIGNELGQPRFNHTATLLPNGKVMITGGAQISGSSLQDVETFDVSFTSWQACGSMVLPRANHSLTVSQDGRLNVIGGFNGSSMENSIESNYFTGSPDSRSKDVPPTVRQSSITLVDVRPFKESSVVTLTGTNFLGVGEAAGGASASGNSSHHNPRVLLQSIAGSGGTNSQGSGEFTLDLTTQIYASGNLWTNMDTSLKITMPPNRASPYPGLGGMLLPYGWYHLRTYTNAIYSESLLVQAGPPLPIDKPTQPISVVQGISSVAWSWNYVYTGGTVPDGFEVFSASSGIFITTIPYSASAGFTHTRLAPNTADSIVVAAYTLSGDGPLQASATTFTNPLPPSNPFFSNVGFNSLQLNWEANGNTPSTIYEVLQSTDNFVTNVTTPIPTIVANATTFAVINFLEPNKTYWYKVRAFAGSGSFSAFTAPISTETLAPVFGLTGTAISATSIQWNWTSPPKASHFFKVYNSTDGKVIATTTTFTYIDVGLSTNSRRSVMVSEVTGAGEGPLTSGATAFTLAALPGLPAVPIVVNSSGDFTAHWTENENPLTTVYNMRTFDAGGQQINTVTTTNRFASYGGFTQAASPFSVRVRAFNGDGISTAFILLGNASTQANPPKDLVVTNTTPSSISVAWSSNNNSSSATYEVTYTTNDIFSPSSTTLTALSFAARSNQTALTVTGLLTSTTYSIIVRAQNFDGFPTASVLVETAPFNGGVPFGSLGGRVDHLRNVTLPGTVGTPPRAVDLEIAANTFPTDTFITLSTFSVTSPCSAGASIGLSIVVDPSLQPLKPVIIRLGYEDGDLGAIPVSQVSMMRVDGTRCVPLKTSVDTAARMITAQLNHFSQFQIAQVRPAASVNNTVVFPNPFYPSRGNGYVTFSQLPALATVRVFTLRGELVYEATANGSGIATWPGTNLVGRSAASGVYLAAVEAGSDKKIVKVVVVR